MIINMAPQPRSKQLRFNQEQVLKNAFWITVLIPLIMTSSQKL